VSARIMHGSMLSACYALYILCDTMYVMCRMSAAVHFWILLLGR
jgi:hypothetical protein